MTTSTDTTDNPVHDPPIFPPEDTGDLSSLARPARTRGRFTKLETLMIHHADVYAQILKYIELGAYDYIAAEAMGVSVASWHKYISVGSKSKPGTLFRRFFDDVTKAKAKARLLVEMQVRRDNPEFWLTKGPGRSRPGREGWTDVDETKAGNAAFRGAYLEHVKNSDLATTLAHMEELGLLSQSCLPPSLPPEKEDDAE
jgi:hypothetical protein